MKRILYIGRYSTPEIRSKMNLYNLKPLNLVRKILDKQTFSYANSAVWHGDYIKELNNYSERYEIHVASPAQGLKNKFQDMVIDGVFYHFYSIGSFVMGFIKAKHYQSNYCLEYRKRFEKICNRVKPDVIVLCGAENAEYSCGVMNVEGIPVILILQTLLNSPKRIAMNVGGEYRRRMEAEVFKHCQYFCTTGKEDSEIIGSINPSAKIIPIRFITHTPPIYNIEKKYDFVFFASTISRNKGMNDIVEALGVVAEKYPNAKLNIIGGWESEAYKEEIDKLISDLKLEDNITYSGRYPVIEDAYRAVQMSRFVVSPGITAFNSTVRESMLMRLPTIVYNLPIVEEINSDVTCLLAAEFQNHEDLAEKMVYAWENPDTMQIIAQNGKQYADRHFGSEEIGKDLIKLIDTVVDSNERNKE